MFIFTRCDSIGIHTHTTYTSQLHSSNDNNNIRIRSQQRRRPRFFFISCVLFSEFGLRTARFHNKMRIKIVVSTIVKPDSIRSIVMRLLTCNTLTRTSNGFSTNSRSKQSKIAFSIKMFVDGALPTVYIRIDLWSLRWLKWNLNSINIIIRYPRNVSLQSPSFSMQFVIRLAHDVWTWTDTHTHTSAGSSDCSGYR